MTTWTTLTMLTCQKLIWNWIGKGKNKTIVALRLKLESTNRSIKRLLWNYPPYRQHSKLSIESIFSNPMMSLKWLWFMTARRQPKTSIKIWQRKLWTETKVQILLFKDVWRSTTASLVLQLPPSSSSNKISNKNLISRRKRYRKLIRKWRRFDMLAHNRDRKKKHKAKTKKLAESDYVKVAY